MLDNAISTSIPMNIGDLVQALVSSGQSEVQEFITWWNGAAAPCFKALTAAGMAAADAAKFVFTELPRPRRLQELSLEMVGTVSTVLTQRSGQQWGAELGFAGLPGIPVTASGNIQQTTENTGTQSSQASSSLKVVIAPADDEPIAADLMAAISAINMPLLPAFNPTPTAPAQSTIPVITTPTSK